MAESKGFTTKPDGNGLGLIITNRLCQVIKASMRMDSGEGRGMTITLALTGAAMDGEPLAVRLQADSAAG